MNRVAQTALSLLLGAALLAPASVFASEVQLSLREEFKGQPTEYTVNLPDISLKKLASITGTELPQIAKYAAQNRKLMLNDVLIADADDVLFQCEFDGMDIVIVREVHNSFSGPLKLLSAMSGHPVQVSKIMLILIKDKLVINKKEIKRKDSAYRWIAHVYN